LGTPAAKGENGVKTEDSANGMVLFCRGRQRACSDKPLELSAPATAPNATARVIGLCHSLLIIDDGSVCWGKARWGALSRVPAQN